MDLIPLPTLDFRFQSPNQNINRLVSLVVILLLSSNVFASHFPQGNGPTGCENDTIAPVITNCPNDTTLVFDSAICGATLTWPAIEATDDCDPNPSIYSNIQSGDVFVLGSTEVIMQAVDSTGNIGYCHFSVTLSNSGFGLEDCPENITISTGEECSAVVNWTPPTILDLCNSSPTLISTHDSGSTFNIDTTIVKYTLSNSNGNYDACSFLVIVRDSTPPTITGCELDTTIYPESCLGVYLWDETQIVPHDNCGNDVTLIPDPVYHSGYSFPKGETTVKYGAIDGASNLYECTFVVTVIDTNPPNILSCPLDTIVNVINQCDTAVTWPLPLFADACDMTVEITQNYISGTTFNVGAYIIVYTASDESNNETQCSFKLTVKDNSFPTMDACPSDTTMFVGDDCTAIYNYAVPMAHDDCIGDFVPTVFPNNTEFEVGNHTITITASDGANETTCQFLVSVADTLPPTTICPEAITIQTNGTITSDPSGIIDSIQASGCATPIVYFSFPEILDNCDGFLSDSTQLVTNFPLGTTSYTYHYQDLFGNSESCTFSVEVTGTAQTITISADNENVCEGGDIMLSSSVTDPSAVFAWSGPNFTSNLPTPTITNFGLDQVGDYTVTITIGGCVMTPASPLHLSLAQAIIANDDSYSISYNTTDTLFVTENDSLYGQYATVEVIQNALNGTSSGLDGHIIYTPSHGYLGADQIIYRLCLTACPDICTNALITLDINLIQGDTCVVPNLISPNDDDLNDALIINCLATGNDGSKMMIYNQWGGLVYTASPYLNDWKGAQDGDESKPLPDGTYFYIFWKDKNAEPQKGFITLFR